MCTCVYVCVRVCGENTGTMVSILGQDCLMLLTSMVYTVPPECNVMFGLCLCDCGIISKCSAALRQFGKTVKPH